jgi:cytochrome c peroxidase
MPKQYIIISVLLCSVASFSFFTKKNNDSAIAVRAAYVQQVKQFESEIIRLQQVALTNNSNALQQQFIKTRLAYKQIETIVEYYFNFYAVKLNGPPIPFFEEGEADLGQQQPTGMQLIEGLIYPNYNKKFKAQLNIAIDELLAHTKMMTATHESNEFKDAFIFDAVTEELYRITAMGITGFDSQTAVNSLAESSAALQGVQNILLLYQTTITKEHNAAITKLMSNAKKYLLQHSNFNTFDRMQFIMEYLNPITTIITSIKKEKGFEENRSPLFYSTIKKNNTLFAVDNFDANKYLDDNTTSTEKINLGRRLFFDKQLSVDNKRSCATCHNPAKAFTDGLPTSVAIDGHTALPRNAPTLFNAALQRSLFLDNRSPSMEDQVLQVLNNAEEMHGSAQKVALQIIQQKEYALLYATAYRLADTSAAAKNIANAIACFERTLLSLNSKFDQYMRGAQQLDQQEINGFNIFMGKAKCGTCHFMPLFSGAKPPRYYYAETEVIGVPAKNGPTKNVLDKDEGRFRITGIPIHKFAFKTPTLRNIALTAPYMHNGVFKTLEEVIEFYNNGGGKGLHIAPVNQTLPFDKLQLLPNEKLAVMAFLKTLTDTAQIH